MGAGESRPAAPKFERTAPPPTVKENTCRTCSSKLQPVRGGKSMPNPVVRCLICPGQPFICGTCLSLLPGPAGPCPNRKCAVVGTLLTCGLITMPTSIVLGCPEFRACPKCYSLIMHDSEGCNNVDCPDCGYSFCYICLGGSLECVSYPCSRATAGRQWFST